jgi:bifunctional UDP-N-acetylglucosamine pyrophosphorylase / glucosamine-1-phosphate N-acetyltransferase
LSNQPLAVIILAAGLGKRFKSSVPKVLHEAAGAPLVEHVMRAVAGLRPGRILVVVGHEKEKVVEALEGYPGAEFVDQPERLGTADAVWRCREALGGFAGDVLVVPGDSPLIRTESLRALVEGHRSSGCSVSLLTTRLVNPAGYGRIVRDGRGNVKTIIEEADASLEERTINEVSAGVWCFAAGPLFEAAGSVGADNAQGERYLPDAALAVAAKEGKMYTMPADPQEAKGVNDRAQLAEAARDLRLRYLEKLAAAGVTVEDPLTTYIDDGVEVGPDTVIRPLTFIEGASRIGGGCAVGPSTRISDSIVEDGAEVTFSVILDSHIGPKAKVGPFAYVRPGTRLREGSKVGAFVEIKASILGEGSKVPHQSYIGDAEIGRGVNIGAGTIIGNYDGETRVKSPTVIEDDALTGSGTTIVAPVRLGKGSVTGAGAVVTTDVGEQDVVMGVPARPVRKRKPRVPRDNEGHGS